MHFFLFYFLNQNTPFISIEVYNYFETIVSRSFSFLTQIILENFHFWKKEKNEKAPFELNGTEHST